MPFAIEITAEGGIGLAGDGAEGLGDGEIGGAEDLGIGDLAAIDLAKAVEGGDEFGHVEGGDEPGVLIARDGGETGGLKEELGAGGILRIRRIDVGGNGKNDMEGTGMLVAE
jgi:hypothetical protein